MLLYSARKLPNRQSWVFILQAAGMCDLLVEEKQWHTFSLCIFAFSVWCFCFVLLPFPCVVLLPSALVQSMDSQTLNWCFLLLPLPCIILLPLTNGLYSTIISSIAGQCSAALFGRRCCQENNNWSKEGHSALAKKTPQVTFLYLNYSELKYRGHSCRGLNILTFVSEN